MNDRALAARRTPGAAEIDPVKHRRARAEIERDELADEAVPRAGNANLSQPSPLDPIVADDRRIAFRHYGIRQQASLGHDAGQVLDVGNVVDESFFRT